MIYFNMLENKIFIYLNYMMNYPKMLGKKKSCSNDILTQALGTFEH